MRLIVQNLLVMVPLFLLLGGMSGGLIHVKKEGELVWGARERTRAAAVTMAEFVRDGWLRAEAMGPEATQQFLGRLPAILEQVGPRNRIERMDLALADGTSAFSWGLSTGLISTARTSPEARAAIAEGTDFVSDMVETEAGEHAVVAIVPLLDREGGMIATLGLRVNAKEYGIEMAEALSLIQWMLAGTGLAGIIVAVWLTWRIDGPLRRIERRIRQVAAGKIDLSDTVTGLQEIEDMDDSLHTVQAVMLKEIAKSRQGLLENEQLRSMDDLLETLGARFSAPLDAVSHGVQVSVRCLEASGASFFDLLQDSRQSALLLGRFPQSRAGEGVVQGQALIQFCRQLFGRMSMEQIVARAAFLFPEAVFTLVVWQDGHAGVEIWQADEDGRPNHRVTDMSDGRTRAIPMLVTGGSAALDRYLLRFGSLRPGELGRDLPLLLGRGEVGTVALLALSQGGEEALPEGTAPAVEAVS